MSAPRQEAQASTSAAQPSTLLPLVGADPKIAQVRTVIERVAATGLAVLVTGESGTGKELVARLIHAGSLRSRAPFVVVDCPSLPPSLFEGELFGHEPGAYTGAVTRQRGKLEQAAGGTVLLDEIGELPLELQPKLLRFLQGGEIGRLGGGTPIAVDTRVISATNRDLDTAVEQGTFRLDLLYRLNAVHVELPTLRERRGDIPLLVAHFVGRHCARLGVAKKTIAPETLAVLLDYAWPGNVRELDSVLLAALALTPGGIVTPESLPSRIVNGRGPAPAAARASLADWSNDLLRALGEAQGNVSRTARILGVHRATVYRWIRARAIDRRRETTAR